MRYWMLVLLLGLVLAMPTTAQENELVNLAHLRFLTENLTIDGQDMAMVHIYSEYPEYEWVDAAGEGLSAVDDVARAAVVYLWQYERTGDPELLELARNCLDFVMYMQAEDGEFYNFITDSSGTINLTGGTSYKSLGWWAMRGFWALGEGVSVFDSVDPSYADTLATAYLRTETSLGATLNNYGKMLTLHSFEIPAWIPGGEPAVAGIGLLGMSAYYQARPNDETASIITKIADGISAYRLGNHSDYPFGMHPVSANAPAFWHAWGADMEHGLVVAGMALGRSDWIESAAQSADSFLLRQLAFENFRNIGVVPDRLNQIAYGTNMLVQTYAVLYRATGEERYAQYAGLAASWYFGNNMAGVPMYDPATGRVLDGIGGPVSWRVNRNSGAESTIEGLMSLIALADMPAALDYLYVTELSVRPYQILEAEDGQRVVGTPIYVSGNWTGEGYISAGRYVSLGEGQRMRLQFNLEEEGEYWLYAAQMRQASNANAFTIPYTDNPPLIDASADEWPEDLPVFASDSARQFLRGAGSWQGAEVDSHSIRLMWDNDNLYVLADVHDPLYEQPYALNTVWQGDALWFYMTNDVNAQRLSAKFTFAQTPDGPQIWDWVNTGFLEGASLAWTATEGAYRYEAAIPWETLSIETPQAGQRIGFEVGRGIGGNSFMNLTGRDPDVPQNLLRLTLTLPDMALDSLDTPEVALSVRLDEQDEVILPQTVSSDSDYFWLERVTAEPLSLAAGEHILRYAYSGESSFSNPGLAKIDAFILQPVIAQRRFSHPDGRIITLIYNTQTGATSLEESQ